MQRTARCIRRLFLLAIILSGAITSGCAVNRATASTDTSLQWDSIKTIHVKQLTGEDGSTKRLIADKLKSKGFTVTTEPEEPQQPDLLVTYVDRWMWDMTMYMIELTVIFRDPKSDFPLARGNSFHTSLTRKSPTEMVDEVIENVLKTKR